MPEVEILLSGYTFNSDQTRLGLSTVALIRGKRLTVVDVSHFGRRNMLVEQLESRGIPLAAVERVILTHAHWDHSQNTDIFPNAEIVIHAKELAYTRNPRPDDFATARYFAETLKGQTVREVSGETEIEPGVTLIETPGHTAGHISVLVDTASGRICIGGDAVSDAGTVGRGTPALFSGARTRPEPASRKFWRPAQLSTPATTAPL